MDKTKNNTVYALVFFGMYVTKFGQFERYNLAFAKKALNAGITPVYIYNQTPLVAHYIEALMQLGVDLHVLNPDSNVLVKMFQIRKLIKQYKPTIVHTHFRGSVIRSVTYVSYLMGVKKRFNTFHCLIPKHKLITKLWMKSLHICCSKLFAVSNAIRDEQINAMKAPSNKIITLRLGVDKSNFDNITVSKKAVREKYKLPVEGIIVANVAFHHPEKGIDILLESLKIVHDKTKEVVYLFQVGQQLAGEGGKIGTEYTNFLQEKAKLLGLKKEVFWMGRQNKVPELLRAADIYVHASRDEGLGLILLEASFSKLPVIGSNVGGIPEVVDNERGFLFEKEQTNELADKLLQLIQSKDLRLEKATKGYLYVDEYYNIDKQIDKMMNYYMS